jgi:hypothetical protein
LYACEIRLLKWLIFGSFVFEAVAVNNCVVKSADSFSIPGKRTIRCLLNDFIFISGLRG